MDMYSPANIAGIGDTEACHQAADITTQKSGNQSAFKRQVNRLVLIGSHDPRCLAGSEYGGKDQRHLQSLPKRPVVD